MGTNSAVDQELEKVGSQHVPVVVVILLAVLAADHESANTAVSEECLVHREIGEVFLDGEPLLGVQRLAGLDCIEGGRGVGGVTGEGIRR